ncbi:MAG: hypothetical protein L0Y43_06555 [Methylococcaceae bacterium]|nr:hypothetical protein [Methylococcaceae bacterium]
MLCFSRTLKKVFLYLRRLVMRVSRFDPLSVGWLDTAFIPEGVESEPVID